MMVRVVVLLVIYGYTHRILTSSGLCAKNVLKKWRVKLDLLNYNISNCAKLAVCVLAELIMIVLRIRINEKRLYLCELENS